MNVESVDRTEQADTNDFIKVFGGHILFQTLYAAVEFDLFTKLSKHKRLSLSQISKELGIKNQPARILLLGLTSSGLVKRGEDGQYFNSHVAELALTSHSPKNLISYVKLQHHVMYKGMFHLVDAMREYKNVGLKEFAGDEGTLYQRIAHNPALKQMFQDAMHELSVHANEELVKAVDFSDTRFLVDVGGGDGTNIIELAKHYDRLTAAVFDLPEMCPITEKKLAESGLGNRLRAVGGNCFEDDFPVGADCYLFSHFCTIWSAEKNKVLFKKAFDALPRNGKIVIFNMMQEDDETGPLTAALGSPYFLAIATGEGMLYTWSEYEKWLEEAGFAEMKRIRLPRDHGVIVGRKR